MTKVTYNTYSCDISGMSREMMKMDGRDSAECQNLEKRDMEKLSDTKDKTRIVFVFSNSKRGENV